MRSHLVAAMLRVSPMLRPGLPSQFAAVQLRMEHQVRMMCGSPSQRTVVDTCREKIIAAISPMEVKVTGAYDDPNGSHITVYCVAEAFEGKRSLARQQMVMKALWDELQGPVHAVDTMVLKTPSEVKAK